MTKALLLCVTLLLAGCSTVVETSYPRLPPWPTSVSPTLSTVGLRTEVSKAFPGLTKVFTADESYLPLPYAWLQRAAWNWHKDSAARATAYVDESRDCDDFSLAFYLCVSNAAANAGLESAPLLGRAIVEISPTSRHVVVIAYTDQGWFYFDPTSRYSGEIAPVSLLPHRVLSLVFGDYNP